MDFAELAESPGLAGTYDPVDVMHGLGPRECDIVVAIECLSEIPDDDAALSALARLCGPAGASSRTCRSVTGCASTTTCPTTWLAALRRTWRAVPDPDRGLWPPCSLARLIVGCQLVSGELEEQRAVLGGAHRLGLRAKLG